MNKRNHVKNLIDTLDQLNQAKKHLEISYKRCQKFGLESPQTEENLIEFEALISRFARLVDMLIHKVFRSIDAVELIDGGTLIDVINRAEKRGLIDSASEIRVLKDIRNDIAHEYLTEKLTTLHTEVYKSVPKILDTVKKTKEYAEKYTKL